MDRRTPVFAPCPGFGVDPAWGMAVETATAKHIYAWKEKTWYFCSVHCKTKFYG